LAEWLAENGPVVLNAEALGEGGALPVRGRRRDAIDHAVGKGYLLVHIHRQSRIHATGKAGNGLPSHLPVMGGCCRTT
jgi:hypothetical protein